LKNPKNKKKFIKNFKKMGFGVRSTWRPLHTLKIFKNCPRDNMENANLFFKKALNFPSSPTISYKK